MVLGCNSSLRHEQVPGLNAEGSTSRVISLIIQQEKYLNSAGTLRLNLNAQEYCVLSRRLGPVPFELVIQFCVL